MFGFLKKAVGGLVDGIRKRVDEKKAEPPEPAQLEEKIAEPKTGHFEKVAVKEKYLPVKTVREKTVIAQKEPEEKLATVNDIVVPAEQKEGIAGKLIGRLRRTAGVIKKKIEEKGIRESDVEELLWNFQLTLVQANIAQEVAEKLCSNVRKTLVGSRIKRSEEVGALVKNSLKGSVLDILNVDGIDIAEVVSESGKPAVIVFLGVNGVGKTLCIAKVARYLAKKNISSIMAAGDTFRAGSIQQLEIHGSKLGIKVIRHDYGSDAAAVCFDAIESARAHGIDAVLVDTAGRLQSNKALMEELKKIVRVAKPGLKIFVGDSLTGSDLVSQCETFNREIGIDGIILTKSDVDEKGGAAISAAYIAKKPILFLGTGQEYDDLVPFEPEKFVDSLFP